MLSFNTKSFQKYHFNDYQSFFSSHNLVISVPQLFTRGYSAHKCHTKLHIKEKLPTKMYAGINIIQQPENQLGKVSYYCIHSNNLITKSFDEVFSSDRTKRIQILLNYLWKQKDIHKFYEINFFAERQKNIGCCFKSSMMTLLGGFVYIMGDQPDLLQDQDAISLMNERILSYSIYINGCSSIKKTQKPTGLSSYTILTPRPGPILQWRGFDLSEEDGDISIDYTNSSGKRWSLSDFSDRDLDRLPLDYGVLFLGKQYHSSFSEARYESTKDNAHSVFDFFRTDLHVEHHSDVSAKDLSTLFYGNIIKSLITSMKNPGDKYQSSSALQSIIDCGWYHVMIEKEHRSMIDAYHSFTVKKQFDNEKLALIPLSSMGVGATFFFACHKHESRDTLNVWLRYLKKYGYQDAQFLYLPRRDGICDDGFAIEQYLSEGLYSRYIEPGSVAFLSSDGRSYLGRYEQIISSENHGVILDSLYKKIYVKGKKLTHKDLSSQSMTVEVISSILERPSKSIHNSQLPPSSYSKNKNEMVGKIIIPFNSLIYKIFNKKLGLVCSGSHSSFVISLEEDLGILHRIKSVSSI